MATLMAKKRSAIGNVQNPDEATLDQVLSRIAGLSPVVERHPGDMEQARQLPEELVSALRSARIFSMFVPRRYGGLELDPPSALRVVAALAKLDGSVGWNAMTGNLGSLMPFLTNRTCVSKSTRMERITSLPVRVNRSARPSVFLEDGGLPAHGRLQAGASMPSGSGPLA
jgi:hypothetical protein